jgi:hypothetical protein
MLLIDHDLARTNHREDLCPSFSWNRIQQPDRRPPRSKRGAKKKQHRAILWQRNLMETREMTHVKILFDSKGAFLFVQSHAFIRVVRNLISFFLLVL